MFVVVDTLHRIVFLEAISFKVLEKRGFNWDFILSYHKTLVLADRFVDIIPRMLLDLLSCESLVWICLEDFVDQILTTL